MLYKIYNIDTINVIYKICFLYEKILLNSNLARSIYFKTAFAVWLTYRKLHISLT